MVSTGPSVRLQYRVACDAPDLAYQGMAFRAGFAVRDAFRAGRQHIISIGQKASVNGAIIAPIP